MGLEKVTSPTWVPVDVSCVVCWLTGPVGSARILLGCLSSVRPWRRAGVRASLTYIWRHIDMFSRRSVWMHFNGPFSDFQKDTDRIIWFWNWKKSNIASKEAFYIKYKIRWRLLPGFTLPFYLAGCSYLCVWSTLFTWNKATKEQRCIWCFLYLISIAADQFRAQGAGLFSTHWFICN